MVSREREYIPFDEQAGYPAGEGIFYECAQCGEVIPSRSETSLRCRCRNILLDVGYGRLTVLDHAQLRIFRQ